MEPNKCATCTHWSPKKSGPMAKHSFALCALGKPWKFLPPQHTCERHKTASDAVVSARVAWLEKSLHVQPKAGG